MLKLNSIYYFKQILFTFITKRLSQPVSGGCDDSFGNGLAIQFGFQEHDRHVGTADVERVPVAALPRTEQLLEALLPATHQ